MNAAVVIIAYSDTPSELELASFRQCLHVLGNHPLIVVCPRSLRTARYDREIERSDNQVVFKRFEDSCFDGIAAYNQMMRSVTFYEAFQEYEYILIYQLDAWVFRDELDDWRRKGYDYIGAPWYSDEGVMLSCAGNGGFSLRKVATFVELLSGRMEKTCCWNYAYVWQELRKISFIHQYDVWRQELFEMIHCRQSLSRYACRASENEDVVFLRIFSFITGIKIANSREALLFSFERFPEDAYQKTEGRLPFGCHAFARYNPEFWARWIPALAHDFQKPE